MKKFFFFLLSFMFCINIISAKTIGSVSCKYDLYKPHNTSSGYLSEEKLTSFYVIIDDYSDTTAKSMSILYLSDTDDSWHKFTYDISSVATEWKYTGPSAYPPTETLRFFPAAMKNNRLKKYKVFYDAYKTSGACPVLYNNISSGGSSYDIENYVLDPDNAASTAIALKAIEELLKEPGSSSWQHKTDFFKTDEGTTTVKDDLVCQYDMEFDMFNIKSNVKFITMYNPTNGAKTYKITINEAGYTYSTLDEDVFLNLGQSGGGDHGIVFIESEQLKKIFKDDACLERTKIYHYYDMGYSRYTITTNQQEASENGAGGRYDNGDGSNDGNAGGSTPGGGNGASEPNLNFNENTMTCSELLSTNMIKVIKAALTLIRIGATIATILIGMMNFLPALTKGDQGAFNAAIKKCIWLVVILMLIILLPVLLRTIGNLFNWDLCGIV